MAVSFAEATKVTKLNSHTYKINLDESFCIGIVPNGGYTASCMLAAANAHLSSVGHTDILTAHFEYPNSTAAGPAIVIIDDIKKSRQLSTLHMTLYQGGLLEQEPWINPSVSRRIIMSYSIHTNLRVSTGITLPTGYEETSASSLAPVPNFENLRARGSDGFWEKLQLPKNSEGMRSLRKWEFYLPRGEPLAPGVLDVWVRFSNGENIKQGALPYVVDSFPHNLYTFLVTPELRQLLQAGEKDQGATRARKDGDEGEDKRGNLWFPTLVMNLETKMALPEEGVEWLAVRVTSKQIKDGKFDLDVLVRNDEGELVALSSQVAMILSMERNTKGKL